MCVTISKTLGFLKKKKEKDSKNFQRISSRKLLDGFNVSLLWINSDLMTLSLFSLSLLIFKIFLSLRLCKWNSKKTSKRQLLSPLLSAIKNYRRNKTPNAGCWQLELQLWTVRQWTNHRLSTLFPAEVSLETSGWVRYRDTIIILLVL